MFPASISTKNERIFKGHLRTVWRHRHASCTLEPALSNLALMIGRMPNSDSTRRWPRLPVDMPVRVVTSKGFSTTVVEGRGTEMSEGGMVLYAGILLNPGDLLEIEFDTPSPSRLPAIVRSRSGYCFGLEFISPLPA